MDRQMTEVSQDFEMLLLPAKQANSSESSEELLRNFANFPIDHNLLKNQLHTLLSTHSEEFEDQELSLEALEDLGGGLGLVDAMVSSSILMVIATQSMGLMGDSMAAIGKSQMRDGLNAAISADLELVRHNVAEWSKSTSVGGQLTYNPDNSACDAGTLATALLSDTSSGLEIGTEEVSLADAPTKLQGFTISRTINVDPDNSNLIRISYTTDGGIINVKQNASMTTPAQGWCA